jgi:hypothetical protein
MREREREREERERREREGGKAEPLFATRLL